MSESQDNVVDIARYQSAGEQLNPDELSDVEFLDFVLSRAMHPAVMNNPRALARQILSVLPGEKTPSMDAWAERARQMSVETADIDDASYDRVLGDEIVLRAIEIIRAKNGHTTGNEQILEAARALINLRAGIVLEHTDIKNYFEERWKTTIARLGKLAADNT